MTTIKEIETAIESLSTPEVDELADWVEQLRIRRAALPCNASWLDRARGAARSGLTTQDVMALTRGDE